MEHGKPLSVISPSKNNIFKVCRIVVCVDGTRGLALVQFESCG